MTARIAAVVPTAARPELLARCLRGLARNAADLREVVVVHSGDTATGKVLAEWAPALPLRAWKGRQTGASARRNEGWRATESELVAFTDDDCEPAPGWAANLVTAFAEQRLDVVQGRVEPHPEDEHVRGTFARTVTVRAGGELFVGANLAVRRTALDRVAGFDERLTGGEDTDLAWRIIETAVGSAAGFAADAMVWHAVRAVSFRQHLRSLPRWATLAEVLRRHPALRQRLIGGVFWKPEHVTATIALAGITAAPVDRRLLALAAPHLLRRVARNGPYAGTELAVGDVVEVGVMIVGSLRHGSLVL